MAAAWKRIVSLALGGLGVLAIGVALFSFGASAYCLAALTGVGGMQPRLGASPCTAYFSALSALLTPTIAAAAAYIGYRQFQTSRAKLMYDLYERRVLVLRGVLAFLSAVRRDGTVKGDEIPALATALSERRYLFERDLVSHLEELQRNAVAIFTKELLFRELPGGSPQRKALVNQHSALVAWMLEQPAEIEQRFETYLKITV
jgi:hypothetical protein